MELQKIMKFQCLMECILANNIKDLKHLGNITCNVQDVCHKELMWIGRMSNYTYIEFYHEYASPNCAPNIYKYGYGFNKGENWIV